MCIRDRHKVPIEIIRSHFIHNYCRTCHSCQGSSIDDKITIYDWKHHFVSRKWLYTCCTRATDLNNVYLIDYDTEEEDEKDLMNYLQKKVDRYKQQDKKAKRQIDPSNFISKEWLRSCLGKCCQNCGESLICSKTSNGKVESNLSAQRLSNHLSLIHI